MINLVYLTVLILVMISLKILKGYRLHISHFFPRQSFGKFVDQQRASASTIINNGKNDRATSLFSSPRRQKLSMASVESATSKRRSLVDQAGKASMASAAVVAAAAVNAAVGMRQLSAPDAEKTFVFKEGAAQDRIGKVDEYGLPLVYDKDLIQQYWSKQGSALSRRWAEFLGYAVPFLTKVITLTVSGGNDELSKNGAALAKDAREIFEKLGPTYIKMGQMMSVRPDVLPQPALEELKILQDSVKPFDTPTAVAQIEAELGGELGTFFTEISEEPVAAASLAQVYKARLASTGEFVAVKIQRPRVLETVSKDLYVLRRAAEVYQGLMDRFAPQQRTNYVALLNEWAVGFYTELDFLNEAANQKRMRDLLEAEGVTGVYIPRVYDALCTRRVMVTEWVDGTKLSEVDSSIVKQQIKPAQEAFSTQLLQVGFFHSDPHPGNILYMHEPRGEARLALIDFGLVASIKQSDMDTMVSAIIHLANRDYPSLVDDFISLGILPSDCDRAKVVPLMDKALTPYVKGGGAKRYEEEIRKTYGMDGGFSTKAGGFQAMTQDALTVLNDIPFSIPPYFALLGRAIVTLEGVALTGDPDYGIIMESYPFVARKLLKDDRPETQRALQEILYTSGGDVDGVGGLRTARLSVLLNSALGVVARSSGGGAFVDLDSIPKDAVGLSTSLKFLLSPQAASLRVLLVEEASTTLDILLRQGSRKAYSQILSQSLRLLPPRPPLIGQFLPSPETLRVPFLIPDKAALRPILAQDSAPSQRKTRSGSKVHASDSAPKRESQSKSQSDIITASSMSTKSAVASAHSFSEGILPSTRQPTGRLPTPRELRRSLRPVFMTAGEMLDVVAPRLTREEELYALSLTDLATQTIGPDAGVVVNGNALLDPRAASRFLLSIANSSGGRLPGLGSLLTPDQARLLGQLLRPIIGETPSSSARDSNRSSSSSSNAGNADIGADVDGLDDLAEGLASLSAEEDAVLRETSDALLARLVDRSIDRLQVLL